VAEVDLGKPVGALLVCDPARRGERVVARVDVEQAVRAVAGVESVAASAVCIVARATVRGRSTAAAGYSRGRGSGDELGNHGTSAGRGRIANGLSRRPIHCWPSRSASGPREHVARTDDAGIARQHPHPRWDRA
jgi:hypothetical protein